VKKSIYLRIYGLCIGLYAKRQAVQKQVRYSIKVRSSLQRWGRYYWNRQNPKTTEQGP